MVMRYFRSKERLFAAAVVFDLRLPDFRDTPKAELGVALVNHFLDRWEGPIAGDELPSLFRAAVTYPEARERLFEVFEQQIAPCIKQLCPPTKARECAALMASQLMGLAYTRYVLKLPPVVRLSRETILRRVGATIQTYLTKF